MSTTNPGTSGPQPGAGRQWPADVQYGSAPDDSGGGGGVSAAAIAAGHEPDLFAVKPIMSIPLAVVVAFVIAFAVAAGFFAYLMNSDTPDPFASPDAVARNKESLNERLQRTERAGLRKNGLREVDQPRLEPLRRREADGLFFTRPEMPTGNSPEIHPEDITPGRTPELQTAGYTGPDKKLAHIPIADAMKIAAETKGMFPVQKTPSKPLSWDQRPGPSNAGRGTVPPAPKVDAAPAEPAKGPAKPSTPKAPAPKPATPEGKK